MEGGQLVSVFQRIPTVSRQLHSILRFISNLLHSGWQGFQLLPTDFNAHSVGIGAFDILLGSTQATPSHYAIMSWLVRILHKVVCTKF